MNQSQCTHVFFSFVALSEFQTIYTGCMIQTESKHSTVLITKMLKQKSLLVITVGVFLHISIVLVYNFHCCDLIWSKLHLSLIEYIRLLMTTIHKKT